MRPSGGSSKPVTTKSYILNDMAATKNIAPVKLELLMAVVHEEKAAYYSSLIQSFQANLQVSMVAKGTTHFLLSYLGVTEAPKKMIREKIRAQVNRSRNPGMTRGVGFNTWN